MFIGTLVVISATVGQQPMETVFDFPSAWDLLENSPSSSINKSNPNFALACTWVACSLCCTDLEARQYLLPTMFNVADVSYSNYISVCVLNPTAAFQPSLIISSCDPVSPCTFAPGTMGGLRMQIWATSCYQLLCIAGTSEKVLKSIRL